MSATSSTPAGIRLRPLTGPEFDQWAAERVNIYAEETVERLGGSIEAATAAAQADFDQHFGDGAQTTANRVCLIIDEDGATVGAVWWGVHPRREDAAFVYDIEVDPEHRGRGIGRQAMLAVQAEAAAAGFSAVGLSVTYSNEPARRLYESLGYEVASLAMMLPLTSED